MDKSRLAEFPSPKLQLPQSTLASGLLLRFAHSEPSKSQIDFDFSDFMSTVNDANGNLKSDFSDDSCDFSLSKEQLVLAEHK